MTGLFVVVAVQLLFAEIHGDGDENSHHHRGEMVGGPVAPTVDAVILPIVSTQGMEPATALSARSNQMTMGI
jgi:hypothetical protein